MNPRASTCRLSTPRCLACFFWAILAAGGVSAADEGTWKTAFVKRGFVGPFDANWAGGPGGTQRMRTPLQFGGTKIRVYVRGMHEHDLELTKMALVQGADDQGKITGSPFPILFGGKEKLELAKGLKSAVSDEIPLPVTAGTWYVEDQYASARFPYAYEVDHGFGAAGDAFTQETLKKKVACRTGILYRVDVFTTDSRPTILCYGDSITHGFGSTPNADRRYPTMLGKLLNRPVLNLGQNADMVQSAAVVPGTAKDLAGVDTVIFLMGINDIILRSPVKSAKAYGDIVQPVINGCHQNHKKIYLGTIPPAGGFAQFDADPAKEKLRTEINAWIAQGHGADGVIDFAAALADPTDPTKLQADCQSDWLHPNDRGYQKMAEAAAKMLAKE